MDTTSAASSITFPSEASQIPNNPPLRADSQIFDMTLYAPPDPNDNLNRRILSLNRLNESQGSTTVTSPPITHLSQKNPLEDILQAWLNNPQANGDKETAVNRIIEAYRAGDPTLLLNNLHLTEIPPEIFPFLSKVEHLSLADNCLSLLFVPKNALPKLEMLFIEKNRLRSFLISKGACPQLRWLNIENNPDLASIPENLIGCSRLMEIWHTNTQIPEEQANRILEATARLQTTPAEDLHINTTVPPLAVLTGRYLRIY